MLLSVFGPVPDDLAWAFGIVGLAALIVALAPLPQLIWGRPIVEFDFKTTDIDNSRGLNCFLFNREVRSKWLRRIGVHREGDVIEADYSISEVGTNRVIVENYRMFGEGGDQRDSEVLKPSWMPLKATPVVHVGDEEFANTMPPDPKRPIPPGTYYLVATVVIRGRIFLAKRKFCVGTRYTELFWC